ncbi:MAG: glycosyltransferase family 61 protein [Rhodomicrobium sp.]
MVSLQYKGRIHKSKFSVRSLRYILSDQAARLFPALRRRWLLPLESQPIGEAASEDFPLPSARVDAPLPGLYGKLGIAAARPLQLVDHIYTVRDALVTGWAGAMMKDGLLLTVRPKHNWVAALRAHPHQLRSLADDRAYFNLLAPIPAKGHIFHWLFNAMVPLLAYLESGGRDESLGLLVNAAPSEIQDWSIEYLKARYGIAAVEPVAQREAVRVPDLKAAIPVPHIPRALQSPLGLARLYDLGRFIAGEDGKGGGRRIYISRNDARLRRVLNEKRLLPMLEALGVERAVLGDLPMERQVALFRQAGIVVAPHGAGLAHIAWCKPGTKVIEFFPGPDGPRGRARNATYDYWLLSRLLGLDYSCHLAGPVETRDDGFSIDEALLRRALEAALAGAPSSNEQA